MRNSILFFLLAVVLYGCKEEQNNTYTQEEYRRADSILKNMRSVDTLQMFVNTYHASRDTRAEVMAMPSLLSSLRSPSRA